MEHAIQTRQLAVAAASAPPHWAVLVVKCCVVGVLSLPVATLFWLVAYQSTPERDLGPIAFLTALGLGIVLVACIALITSAYPPVSKEQAR
jgi:hypothetical protein